MFRIVEDINNSGVERKIDAERLKKMFGAFWHELEEQVSSTLSACTDERHSASLESGDTIRPILEEILVLVRQQVAIITNTPSIELLKRELERAKDEMILEQKKRSEIMEISRQTLEGLLHKLLEDFEAMGIPEETRRPLLHRIARHQFEMDERFLVKRN